MIVGFEVTGISGIPEVRKGDDLAALIVNALRASADELRDDDIVLVTSKIVSKSEGRVRPGDDREAAIDEEAVRTISEWTSHVRPPPADPGTPATTVRTRIVETRHGLVLAAAGVDASNVEAGHVVLLPQDPDASARNLRAALREAMGVNVAVIVTDTIGRPWRQGVTDIAIGAAGVRVTDDLRGQRDSFGNELGVTVVAVADELAAASELVRAKLAGVPAAIVRGLADFVLASDDDGAGAAVLVRPASEDRFRLGTPEAMRAAVTMWRETRGFSRAPVESRVIDDAMKVARGAYGGEQVRFAAASGAARDAAYAALSQTDGAVARAAAAILVVDADSPLAAGAAIQALLTALAVEGVGATFLPFTEGSGLGVVVLGYPKSRDVHIRR